MRSTDLLLQELCSAAKELYKVHNLTETEIMQQIEEALNEADEELEKEA